MKNNISLITALFLTNLGLFLTWKKVEEFLMEMKAAEEEVARWKEACELEVEAAKVEIEERDKMVMICRKIL